MFNKNKIKKEITANLTEAAATLTDAEALKKEIPTLTDYQAEGIAYAFKHFIEGITDKLLKVLDKARNEEEARAILDGFFNAWNKARSEAEKPEETPPLLTITVKGVKVKTTRKPEEKTAKPEAQAKRKPRKTTPKAGRKTGKTAKKGEGKAAK